MDTLGTWDYVVFGIFLLVSIAIGIFYRFSGGRQQTVQVSACIGLPWVNNVLQQTTNNAIVIFLVCTGIYVGR